MDDGVAIEPLPPGIMEEDEMQAIMTEAQNAIAEPTAPTNEEIFNDPGTPLENETHGGDGAAEVVDTLEAASTMVAAALAEEADGEAQDEDEDEDDDDDDVEITIGAINTQPTFRPGIGRGGAVGAKPTSKLDMDATAQINGQSVFDVDLNSLEDKPWRKPGADITDYFNYGFTEESWQIYCERQKKLRQEFGSAAQANKVYFSQPPIIIGGQAIASHQQTPMPVPTLEQGKAVPRTTQPTQIINLVPPAQRQENQQQQQHVLRTVVPAVPSAVRPVIPVVTQAPPKPAAVLTPAVPTPAEQVSSMFDNAAALYDSEPSSPGTPPPRPGSTEHEDSNPPPNAPRSTAQPPPMTSAPGPGQTSEITKITSTVPPSSTNFSVPNMSIPPPRVMPPTNMPPPGVGMARFGPPPHMFTSMPPPGFGNPPTNLPPPGFGNPPPPGLPPHHFPPGPFGFPPPMRPQMQPPRFGPPPGAFGGFEQQPNMSRAEAHSPASYSDRSSDSDDRGDRYDARFPPGSAPSGGPPPGARPRVEHRRSRSPHSSGRHGKYSHGHSSSRHRSRSPIDRDSDKERDRGSSRRGRDEDDKKKSSSRSRREDSASDKKKSSSKSSRDDGRSSSSTKKRKRSKERKEDEKSSRH